METINIKELENNIFTIKNKKIRLFIYKDGINKIIDFNIDTKEYNNLILEEGILTNIIKDNNKIIKIIKDNNEITNIIKDKNKIIRIKKQKEIDTIYYDYFEYDIGNEKKYLINTSNIISIIINSIIYYLKKYENEKIEEFKQIIMKNIIYSNIIEEIIDKNSINQKKIFLNKKIFKEINNMKLKLHIQLYNKQFILPIEDIIYIDDKINFKLLLGKNYKYFIKNIYGRIDENLNYKYDLISYKYNSPIYTLNLDDFNDEYLNIYINEKSKINLENSLISKNDLKLPKQSNHFIFKLINIDNRISSDSCENILYHSFLLFNKYNIKIKDAEYPTNLQKRIIMLDKNNDKINYNDIDNIGRRRIIFFTIGEDNTFLNLKKNDCIGICNIISSRDINIRLIGERINQIDYNLLSDPKYFIIKKEKSINNINYSLNIIGEFIVKSPNNIYCLSFEEVVNDFINVIKTNKIIYFKSNKN